MASVSSTDQGGGKRRGGTSARPLTEIWGDTDGRQQASGERIAVIPRSLFRGRSSEDRDIAAAIIVEVFDAPFAGGYPVLKNLDFGFNRHAGARSTPLLFGLARDRRRRRLRWG